MAIPKAKCDESPELNTNLWKTKLERTLKKSIFEFYSQLYHTKNINEKSLLSQKVKESLVNIIWCFQTISLIWIPKLEITNWSENKTIWEIIGYSRLDNICLELGIIIGFLYLSIAIAFIIFLFIDAMVLLYYYSQILPVSILSIFIWIFDLWSAVFFIPSLTLYSVILKYNFLSRKYISAYKINDNSIDFEINAIWQVIIIFIMIIMFILIIFHIEFSGEIRHSISSKVLKAKAHSRADAHIVIFTYFSPILYALTDEDYMIYFQLLMLAISLILIAEIMVLFPYFSIYYTLLRILGLFVVALISFGFILGYLMDNSLIIIFVAIILGPLSALFVIQFTLKLQNNLLKNIPENLSEIKSKYQLERSLRHFLCNNDVEHKDLIIYLFETFFIEATYKGKLQMIWASNYCLFSLKDESLAKIKLSRIKSIPDWNLEANIQEYNCTKTIQESLLTESAKFISYLQQLHLVKKTDLKLCVNLLKFWEELTSLNPDLNRMKKRLIWIDKTIQFLIDKYSQLSIKFPNSKESLSLYASLMKDIIFEKENANFLKNRLRAINMRMINNDSSSFSYFDDSNAVLIFSAEEDNFGRILFSNTRAKDIMKYTPFSIDGGNIKSFIPSYYWENLKECAIWYSHFCSGSEITLNEGFLIELPGQCLEKFVGKASITTIDDFLVFILVFNGNSQINQIALLSENGEIWSHSKAFPKCIGKGTDNLVGYNLNNLCSETEKYSLGKYDALQKQKMHYSRSEYRNLKIFYAFFISDYDEKSRNKDSNSLLDIKNKKETVSQSLLGSDGLNKIPKKEFSCERSFNSETNLNLHGLNQKLNEMHFSEEKSESYQSKKFNSLVASSSRKINILHAAFILSILSVLGTNIAVLFYAFSNINFIRNMDLPLALGEVDKRLQQVSLTSRIIWSLSHYGGSMAEPIVELAWSFIPGQLNNLRGLYLNITSSLPDWNYCSGQSIFTDENIKIWTSNENEKINLLDLLSKSIQIGNEFERKYNNSEDYTSEITFLTLNNFGEVTKYCNDSLYQVIDCQKSIMLEFKTEVYILLILGVGVLALCICVMIPLCNSTINHENEIWNNLRKKGYENYSELKQTLLERIKNVHCQPEILHNTQAPSNKKINFKSYWKYIWRISIYFIAVSVFSITNITLLYQKCTDYLSYRPDVMKEMINKQILQNSLAIWTTLSQFEIWGFPSADQYFDIYPYMNSKAEYLNTVLFLRQSSLNLRNPKYSPIISSSIKEAFYEKDSYLTNYFDYGTVSGEELSQIESFYFAFSNLFPEAWVSWVLNMLFTNWHYADLANKIDKYSQSVIEAQVNSIVGTFVTFAMSSIAIYFALYFVFFKREKQLLKKINAMLKIMPK